jgi:magnesium-transporting ATPase (P-type)
MTNIVAVIVAFVPDGLPVSVTMTLSLIAYRLVSKYEVVVTKLGTVETLGSVSIIASDKTGTITENKMKLRRIVTCGGGGSAAAAAPAPSAEGAISLPPLDDGGPALAAGAGAGAALPTPLSPVSPRGNSVAVAYDTSISAQDVAVAASPVCQRIIRNSVLCNAVDIRITPAQKVRPTTPHTHIMSMFYTTSIDTAQPWAHALSS